MSVAIPPIPHYVFMVWCSVKAQGQLYLYRTNKLKFVYVGEEIKRRLNPKNACGPRVQNLLSSRLLSTVLRVICIGFELGLLV
jgi:hypothetical protein